ncbi:MAG: ATP-binding protein [Firmicutes bacterium]|nr:ATP-binding protein [Bacillota bacterium]
MLYRKIAETIEKHLLSQSDKIMVIQGARQVGKSFIIREVGSKLFKNFIEVNFVRDNEGPRLFKDIRTVEDFYFQLSTSLGDKMGSREDTLIFLDEIQEYPQYLTMLKFFREDKKYTFIASGSLLGIALRNTVSIPVGSITVKNMYPLDFQEFLIANGFAVSAIDTIKERYNNQESLDEKTHNQIMDLFRKYLLVGGLPDAVNEFVQNRNLTRIREIQWDIRNMYVEDASKYEKASSKKLLIRKIYGMLPSFMENKKKRLVLKDIEGKKGARASSYSDEFEYLTTSGIALGINAISNPVFPLGESEKKNLTKLYMNDVGLLTGVLFHNNISAVMEDEKSINLGGVYETVVAQELTAHCDSVYYYDNRQKGEVDFIINDYQTLSTLPIEVKSGRDYSVHSALNKFVNNKDYGIKRGIVLSNKREVTQKEGILYLPIYYSMFIYSDKNEEDILI